MHSNQTPPPPPYVPMPILMTYEDLHTRLARLEQEIRRVRVSDRGFTWDDSDKAYVVSSSTGFLNA